MAKSRNLGWQCSKFNRKDMPKRKAPDMSEFGDFFVKYMRENPETYREYVEHHERLGYDFQ